MEQNKKAMSIEDLNDVSGGMKVTIGEKGNLKISDIDNTSSDQLTDWFKSRGFTIEDCGDDSDGKYINVKPINPVIKKTLPW